MPKKNRSAAIHRKTKETDISLKLTIDGTGLYKVNTPIPFLSHMLEAFSRHGFFDLTLKSSGDIDVDDHHLVEDIGLVLGQTFDEALGDKRGIARYGFFTLPMDEVLSTCAVDLSGRPCLIMDTKLPKGKIKKFDLELVHEFFQAFTNTAKINLHFQLHRIGNKHHVVESMFKSFARAMDMATGLDGRVSGVPSTKGSL